MSAMVLRQLTQLYIANQVLQGNSSGSRSVSVLAYYQKFLEQRRDDPETSWPKGS